MEMKKYTTDELRVMSEDELKLVLRGLPNHKEELERGFLKLPDSLKPSAMKLIELLLDDTAMQITIDGPKSLSFTQLHGKGFKYQGPRQEVADFDLIDLATYNHFFNQFFLPLTDIPERVGGSAFLFEGFLSIPDSKNRASVFPRTARVHAIGHPIVDNLQVTIAIRPRD